MRRLDKIRLELKEIKCDWKNYILAFLVETSLLSIIFVVLMFTLKIDILFDKYLKKEMPGCYSVEITNITEKNKDLLLEGKLSNPYIYTEKFLDSKFYLKDKEKDELTMEIYMPNNPNIEKEIEDMLNLVRKNTDEYGVWMTKATKDEENLSVGDVLDFEYTDKKTIKCKILGVLEEKEDEIAIFIPFSELKRISVEDFELKAMADLNSISNYEWLRIKYKKNGLVIVAEDLQEILTIVFLVKAIFVGLTIVGLFLCMIAIGNIFAIKIQLRKKYIIMLREIGMKDSKIQSVFQDSFMVIHLLSCVTSYFISLYMIFSINTLLVDKLGNISLSSNGLVGIVTVIFIVICILMRFMLRKPWKESY